MAKRVIFDGNKFIEIVDAKDYDKLMVRHDAAKNIIFRLVNEQMHNNFSSLQIVIMQLIKSEDEI